MSDTFRLLRYKKSDREEVFTFLRSVYSSVESDRLISHWGWKYDANPFNHDVEPYILLLKDGNKIIGMEGAIPLRVAVNGKERWVINICDLTVHPDYRGRGLSRRIVAQIWADNPMSFSWLNEISHRVVAPLGTSRRARLVSLVKPIDFGLILQRRTGSRLFSCWGGLLTTGAHYLARPLCRHQALPGITVTQVGTFDHRVNILWERMCREYPVMVVRDQRYLNWRFICRPDTKYTLLVATRGPDLVGYLVLRSAKRAEGWWGYIIDFLVEDSSSSLLALLVKEAVERLRHEGVVAISCRATMSPYRRIFYRQGFYPWYWGQRGYFCTRVTLPDPELQVFGDPQQWFSTMGDGDLEMAV